jgi:hypothetical protein
MKNAILLADRFAAADLATRLAAGVAATVDAPR